MANSKGRPRTKGMVKRNPASDTGAPANSDLVEYTPPMVLDDLNKIKARIRKATYTGRDISKLCKVFTIDALTVFVKTLADESQSTADRQTAAKFLIERGWGKADQIIKGDKDAPIAISIKWEGEGDEG